MNIQQLEQLSISNIQKLVQINTVRDVEHKEVGKPFGPGIYNGLQAFADMASSIGMDTFIDPDGYYAYSEIGPKDQPMIGILAHIDTVGLGDASQWTQASALSGEIVDDKIIGRGSLDDKGPLVINLMAIKGLIDSGYQFKHRVRMIVGGAEETTWEGINKYKQEQEFPIIGYAPDAEFPLINGEQGIVQFSIKGPGSDHIKVTTNNSINAVCDFVEANVNGETISFEGKAAHAMEAHKGDNAINKLVLSSKIDDNSLVPFIKDHLLAVHGQDLFSDISNETMMVNIGNIFIDQEASMIQIDIRLPLNIDEDAFINNFKELVKNYNLEAEVIKYQPQLYVNEDSSLVKLLLDVYNTKMNTNAKPLQTGGGTYARAFDNFVAFGLVFSEFGMIDKMHQANECLEIKFIKPALEIYMKAIQGIDNLELK